MAWQAECWRDFDRMRAQLREDLGHSPGRRLPLVVRGATWAMIGLMSVATGEPLAAVPAVVLFEAVIAPRLGRAPSPTLGPLRPWHPPESYRESPEAPAPWALRDS